jgi:hypothetical protein
VPLNMFGPRCSCGVWDLIAARVRETLHEDPVIRAALIHTLAFAAPVVS